MFRFHAETHTYLEDGRKVPHITGMLLRCGIVDDRWFTEESACRGQQIHKMTADFDLGGIPEPQSVTSKYKGYLLGHVAAMAVVRPEFLEVEEAYVHPEEHFGGRPDRVGRLYGALSVLEGKSTARAEDAHRVQTALQAILVAPKYHLPPETIRRYVVYWRADGRWKLEEHTAPADFREARRVIAACCH